MTAYPSHLFAGAKLKAERAYTHFNELHQAIAAFEASKPYTTFRDLDLDGLQKHIRFRFNRLIPMHWACIVGDIIHNLRSALDLLAVDLARANGHTSNSAIKGTYFPISADQEAFERGTWDARLKRFGGAGVDKIKHLAPADRDRIAALKPYRGGNDLLWKLHQLEILDKHTLLVPVATAMKDKAPILYPPINRSDVKYWISAAGAGPWDLPLNDGDILATYGAHQPDDSVDVQVTVFIAFGEGQVVEREPLIPTLNQFGEMVSEIIAGFDARRAA